MPASCGVPQGSVQGPLLFLLCTNAKKFLCTSLCVCVIVLSRLSYFSVTQAQIYDRDKLVVQLFEL